MGANLGHVAGSHVGGNCLEVLVSVHIERSEEEFVLVGGPVAALTSGLGHGTRARLARLASNTRAGAGHTGCGCSAPCSRP